MDDGVEFYKQRHVKFFARCLDVLPNAYQTLDTNRMTVLFFAIFGLDILGELEAVIDARRRKEIISWVYSLQVLRPIAVSNATERETNGQTEKRTAERSRDQIQPTNVKNGLRTDSSDSKIPSPSPLYAGQTESQRGDAFSGANADPAAMLGFRCSPVNGARLSAAIGVDSLPETPPRARDDDDDIFFGSGVANAFDSSHVTMTYNALAILLILKDDFRGVDREAILTGLKALQKPDGSFSPMADGGERDMRFLFCAAAICSILADDCAQGMDVDKATDFIVNSFTYEGAFGMCADAEAHGGSSFCALASLVLMKNVRSSLSDKKIQELKRWLCFRQANGFQGRANKPVDCCYSFWVGASLKLLDAFHLAQIESNVRFTLSCQYPIAGGFAKWPDCHPDALHACLGLAGLSLLENECRSEDEDPEKGDEPTNTQRDAAKFGLKPIHPSLSITASAFQHLIHLRKNWNS